MADKELDIITTPNFNDEIEDAVAKKHSQNTDTELGALTADINLNAHKILKFATPVTTKTTTDTLTIAEAGLIKVSAASAYTLTLPTAVGHEGLTYHFVKTDANYNLITLDGNGTETFNFPNDDGVPKETYTRLNTYCAEVTVVSDGSNWQCINEKLGQVPECLVYLGSDQLDFTSDAIQRIDLDTESYNVGANFDMSTWVSGNATSTSAGHLVDSGGAFTSDMVNKRVKNTTDSTYTYVTAYNSATDLTVRDDIFVSGEGYEIKNAKFIAPIAGRYNISALVDYQHATTVADHEYYNVVQKNGVSLLYTVYHCVTNVQVSASLVIIDRLEENDYIELFARNFSGVNTVDVRGDPITKYTHLQIRLISKD